MHAQVNRIPLHPDKIEESLALWNDRLLVAYRAQPGFRGATLLSDEAGGSGLALLVLLWDSAADSERASQSEAIHTALIPFQPLFAGGIDNEDYTVLFEERVQRRA